MKDMVTMNVFEKEKAKKTFEEKKKEVLVRLFNASFDRAMWEHEKKVQEIGEVRYYVETLIKAVGISVAIAKVVDYIPGGKIVKGLVSSTLCVLASFNLTGSGEAFHIALKDYNKVKKVIDKYGEEYFSEEG